MLRQRLAVYDRAKSLDAAELSSQLWLNLEQGLKRHLRQDGKLRSFQTELGQQRLRDVGSPWTRRQVAARAALQDRAGRDRAPLASPVGCQCSSHPPTRP